MLIGGRASCTRRFGRQVVLKWWYAARLTRAGFHVLFSDADVAWLADPLAAWERSFDLQGLSDVRRAAACARRSSSGSRQPCVLRGRQGCHWCTSWGVPHEPSRARLPRSPQAVPEPSQPVEQPAALS